jgi:tetraacyldisaccharide 4'-kinase
MYEGITGVRNWFYDHNWLKATHVDAKVISVGNLTLGGTGKTPVTLAMLEILKKRGYSSGVVSRGYKREQKGVLEVDISHKTAAQTFGDEPALIKSSFPEVPVVVGARRVQAAQALLAGHKVDFIVCDDAFQHRRLHRDLNLLLLDATEPIKNYRVVPVGRGRERLQPALRRADFLILTKTNLISSDELSALTEWLDSRTQKPILRAEYTVRDLRALDGKTARELKDPVYMVSGIAKPQAFEQTLKDRVRVVKHRSFPDHHRYADLEVEEILDEASQLQARWVLTTAKDSMKLAAFPRLRDRLWVVDLGLEFKGEVKAFYEAVDRVARSNS